MVAEFRLAVGATLLLVLGAASGVYAQNGGPKAEEKKRGSVLIKCPVEGAQVYINGDLSGSTPMKLLRLPPGLIRIKIKKPGYLDVDKRVRIRPGKRSVLSVDLLPFAGVLDVAANIERAKVWVDGKLVGRVPVNRVLKPGRHTIRLGAPGYAPYEQVVNVEPGENYKVNAQLSRGSTNELSVAPVVMETKTDGELNELALEELPPPPIDDPDLEVLPQDPLAVQLAQRPKPWWQEWVVWAGVGAVVTGGVVLGILLSRDDPPEAADCVWTPGSGVCE